MSKAARLELIRRIREDGPKAYLDPRKPVHLIAEQLPPEGEQVKVWWESGNGTGGVWLGDRWELRDEGDFSAFGELVKWQRIPPAHSTPSP
ncbi:MAG TPA: hypothetical protein VIM61_06560 [Chthoniobacterales bacterium]|jgi:hypothetical protein